MSWGGIILWLSGQSPIAKTWSRTQAETRNENLNQEQTQISDKMRQKKEPGEDTKPWSAQVTHGERQTVLVPHHTGMKYLTDSLLL